MSGGYHAGSDSTETSPCSSPSLVTFASLSLSSSPLLPLFSSGAAVRQVGPSHQLGQPLGPSVACVGGAYHVRQWWDRVSMGLFWLGCVSRPSAGIGGSRFSLGSSRKQPLLALPLCNRIINSYKGNSNDFRCPICFDMIEEAYMTKCGHSFCYKYIHHSLDDNNRCTKCNYVVDSTNHLYPNLLNLMEFLKIARRNRREQLGQFQELRVLEEDIKRVEKMSDLYSPVSEDSTVTQLEAPPASHSSIMDSTEHSQHPDLEQYNFCTRVSHISDDSRTTSQLDEFQKCLSKIIQYNLVQTLATLSYPSDLYNDSSIVSGIEFEQDCDYFAIAEVTMKIKVYEYGRVIQDAVAIH
ncbi:LOW QUALITY PROTEIN: E3 ubiquitin-protein ligase COP1 [Plecturocebus cupreus]